MPIQAASRHSSLAGARKSFQTCAWSSPEYLTRMLTVIISDPHQMECYCNLPLPSYWSRNHSLAVLNYRNGESHHALATISVLWYMQLRGEFIRHMGFHVSSCGARFMAIPPRLFWARHKGYSVELSRRAPCAARLGSHI